jgi:hypothetical protein
MSAYRTLSSGSSELQVPAGWVLEDVPLKFIEKPQRDSSVCQKWALEPERLLSVLDAMLDGVALPPVRVENGETGFGPLRVANGFHRYFASLALGYLELPVLRRKPDRQRMATVPDVLEQRQAPMLSLTLSEYERQARARAGNGEPPEAVLAVEIKPPLDRSPLCRPHRRPEQEKKRFVPRAVQLRLQAAKEAKDRREAFEREMQVALGDRKLCARNQAERDVAVKKDPSAGRAWNEVARRLAKT